MSNSFFDWVALTAQRFVKFDTVRSADANDALDLVSAGFTAVEAAIAATFSTGQNGTSASAVAVGTGSKSFTASIGKGWVATQFLLIASSAAATNFMHGQVTSYDATTGALVVNVTDIGGSGSHSDWVITPSGSQGAAGVLGGDASTGINWLKGPDIASAATIDPWDSTQGNVMSVTGTVATSALAAAPTAGAQRILIPTGAWPLTNGANFIIPNGDYVCAAGDVILVTAITTTQFRVSILARADGRPVNRPGLELLATATAASSAALDFTSLIDGTYDEYVFELINLVPATSAAKLWMRTSANAGGAWDASAGDYYYKGDEQYTGSAVPNDIDSSTTATKIQFSATNGASNTAAHGGISGTVRLYNPASATYWKHITAHLAMVINANTLAREILSAHRASASAVNGVRFLFDSGNIASGTIRMYGVKK